MKDLNALNIFVTNILLVLMYKVKNNTIPSIFQNRFMLKNKHKYTTRSSAENYKKPKKNLQIKLVFYLFSRTTPVESNNIK